MITHNGNMDIRNWIIDIHNSIINIDNWIMDTHNGIMVWVSIIPLRKFIVLINTVSLCDSSCFMCCAPSPFSCQCPFNMSASWRLLYWGSPLQTRKKKDLSEIKSPVSYIPSLATKSYLIPQTMRITTRLKLSVGIWPDKFPPKHS